MTHNVIVHKGDNPITLTSNGKVLASFNLNTLTELNNEAFEALKGTWPRFEYTQVGGEESTGATPPVDNPQGEAQEEFPAENPEEEGFDVDEFLDRKVIDILPDIDEITSEQLEQVIASADRVTLRIAAQTQLDKRSGAEKDPEETTEEKDTPDE